MFVCLNAINVYAIPEITKDESLQISPSTYVHNAKLESWKKLPREVRIGTRIGFFTLQVVLASVQFIYIAYGETAA